MATIGKAGSKPSYKPKVSDLYTATLIIKDDSGVRNVRTPLPENYSFSLTSEYDNPFNQPLSEAAEGIGGFSNTIAAGSTAGRALGHTTLNRWLSGAAWSGGSEFEIEVPFVLQAFTDAKAEVTLKMLEFLKLAAPKIGGSSMLKPPGPHISVDTGGGLPSYGGLGGTEIEIQLGKFFRMKPCIIRNVSEDFDTQMDVNGNPIGAVVRLSLSSYWTCTVEDLEYFFKVRGSDPSQLGFGGVGGGLGLI